MLQDPSQVTSSPCAKLVSEHAVDFVLFKKFLFYFRIQLIYNILLV